MGETTPDLVILLDLSPEVGLARKKDQNKINRLDAETLEFHKNVRDAYLTMAETNPKLWRVVNAETGVEEIHSRIKTIVFEALKIDR